MQTIPPPEPVAVVEPPPTEPAYRDDPCPSCQCRWFTPGGPVVSHHSNGIHGDMRQSGDGIVCCLGCGERWYGTPEGLKKPHADALPPAWSAHELARAKAAAQFAASQSGRVTTPDSNAKRKQTDPRPSDGFRQPPPPVR